MFLENRKHENKFYQGISFLGSREGYVFIIKNQIIQTTHHVVQSVKCLRKLGFNDLL